MTRQTISEIKDDIYEHEAPNTKSTPWNAANFSVSDQWMSQDDDVLEVLEDCSRSSAHLDVDSSDDGSDRYSDVSHEIDTPHAFAGRSQADEMKSTLH